MSMEDMLAKEGNTECMNATIQRYYDWALQHGDLSALCLGCFDPFCHREQLEGKCVLDEEAAEAMHGSTGTSSGTSSSGGDHVFVEVMEQHGKGLLIFGVMTVACLVVMCIILIVIVWMAKKKRARPPEEDDSADHDGGRSNIQL